MRIDWNDLMRLADFGGLSPCQLKALVPLERVAADLGLGLRDQGERLVGLCPFHTDTNPSFALWGDHRDRWGCWACSTDGGDHFDLIMEMTGVSFAQAREHLIRIAVDSGASTEPMPRPLSTPASSSHPPAWFARYIEGALTTAHYTNLQALRTLIFRKGLGGEVTAEWLHQSWRVGAESPFEVVIPHFDRSGRVVAIKTRELGDEAGHVGHPMAKRGSKLSHLYGVWRDAGAGTVVLCEGESDTWRMSAACAGVDVFGLPSGAKRPRSAWLAQLRTRKVLLAFDGDRAGREASSAWLGALPQAVDLRVPGGHDICSLSSPQLARLVDVVRGNS